MPDVKHKTAAEALAALLEHASSGVGASALHMIAEDMVATYQNLITVQRLEIGRAEGAASESQEAGMRRLLGRHKQSLATSELFLEWASRNSDEVWKRIVAEDEGEG